jgi:prophage antirepressor-like protein
MTELIQSFDFNTKDIRIIKKDNIHWFIAKDICNLLKLSNVSQAVSKLPDKWKGIKQNDTLGGKQNMITISEAGVYRLIMRSDKIQSQRFQEWVCENLLPTLRQKGEYRMNEEYQNKLKQLEEDKTKVEEEKAKLEEENKKLTKKYIKPPKEVYDGKNVVYLMTSEDGEKSREYVVGKAQDLANRKEDYNHNKIHNFKVMYYISCKSSRIMDILESVVLSKMGKYRNKAGRDVFELPKENDINLFTSLFDDVLKFFGDVEDQHIVFAKKTPVVDKEKEKEYRKEYYEEHKEEVLERQKEYYEENKEKIEVYKKDYAEKNSVKIAEKRKEYYEENKEHLKSEANGYYEDRKEDILEQRKEFYVDNKEQILKERADYYKENYETKIKVQRQKKETCECGMIVSHYCMKKHKQSARHIERMKSVSS